MITKGRNDYCNNCETFNTVLDGVCCKCSFHTLENRPATPEEVVSATAKLDKAIAQLNKILDKP